MAKDNLQTIPENGEKSAGISVTLKFTDSAVEAKYRSVFGIDKDITVIRLYSGKLSNITLAAADKMYDSGDNQIELKQAQ